MLHHITAQLIADGPRVPQGPAPQVLEAMRRGVAAHFGQRPAVLALCRAPQPGR